jgi:hypothetical protein
MEEQSCASTHPLGHTGPVTGTLYLYIVVMFSFLNISMGVRLVVMDLHLSEQELHLVCIIVTLNVMSFALIPTGEAAPFQ